MLENGNTVTKCAFKGNSLFIQKTFKVLDLIHCFCSSIRFQVYVSLLMKNKRLLILLSKQFIKSIEYYNEVSVFLATLILTVFPKQKQVYCIYMYM